MNLPPEFSPAQTAVTTAARICRRVQNALEPASAMEKPDRSPVTVADFAAQAAIIHTLHAADPTIPVVGEEDAAELRDPTNNNLAERVVSAVQSELPQLNLDHITAAIDAGNHPGGPTGRFWTLDPIDGTKGFLRQQQYAVALALIEDGQPTLALLACPNLTCSINNTTGTLLHAARGQGAFQTPLPSATLSSNATPIHVAPTTEQDRFCESVESGHSAHDRSEQIARLLNITQPPHRIDSQCKYAALARGDATIYLRLPTRADYQEKIWDHAAGALIATEAGGTVTDIHGQPLDFAQGRTLANNQGIVVSNGSRHDHIINAIRTTA